MPNGKRILDKKIYVIGIVFVLALFLFVVMKTEFLSLNFFGENEGGRLVIARHSDSISLDPAIVTDFESFQVSANIYECLVTTDNNGVEILPGLAKSWEVSEDGLKFVFKLRENVVFHDNTPFDAEAVVFNFERWMNEESPYHIGQFIYWNQSFGGNPGLIKSITALSKYTFEIVLNEPYTPILSVLAMPAFGIASPTAIIKYNEDLKTHPTGTGPYILKEWSDTGRVELVYNEKYYKKHSGVSELVFETLSTEEDALQALETGDIHIINQIDERDVETISDLKYADVYYMPFLNISYLAMNHSKKPFDNLLVRQAISHVVDRDELITTSYDLMSRPAYSFLPPTVFGYNEGFKTYTYNIEKGKDLLAKAGYPHGFETTIWVMDQPRTYYPYPKKVATYLQEQLALIHINAEILEVKWDEYLESVRLGEHDLAIVGWQGDYADPDNFLYTMFNSSDDTIGSGLNYSYYSNGDVDELLKKGRRTADKEFRSFIYRDLQQILVDNMVGLPLAHTMMALGVNNHVKDFEPHISGMIYAVNIELDENDE